jgi:methylated-DNA-protein-cysteine methyltransferase-like protein
LAYIAVKFHKICSKPMAGDVNDMSFFEQVYEVVRLIPHGRVSSYGAIAKYLGTAGSSRMVGWAMNACHGVLPPVPAHRVVNRNGILSGKAHFPGPDEMQHRLEAEGVLVKDDKVVDFHRLFWDPAEHLL